MQAKLPRSSSSTQLVRGDLLGRIRARRSDCEAAEKSGGEQLLAGAAERCDGGGKGASKDGSGTHVHGGASGGEEGARRDLRQRAPQLHPSFRKTKKKGEGALCKTGKSADFRI